MNQVDQFHTPGPLHPRSANRGLIGRVRPDHPRKFDLFLQGSQHLLAAVPILYTGGVTTNAQIIPKVSATRCRLRPLVFFLAS